MSTAMTAEHLQSLINGFRQSRILLTAAELGVCDALAEGARSAADVARCIAADTRATDRLLRALCAMGVLRNAGDEFRNTEMSARFLVTSSDEYLGMLGHYNALWDRWSTLTEAVRAGGAVYRSSQAAPSAPWLEHFIEAMHYRALPQAADDVNLIDFHDAASALDLGGGSGAYAMAMARVKQDLRVTVFDLPEVVPLTRNYIEIAGLSHRIDTRAGDYLRDDIGSGYDIVFLSAIVHSNTVEENRLLLHRCVDALAPGGTLIVQDFIMDEDRVHPPHGALLALNMLVATAGGDTFTEDEICSWMEECGLEEVQRRDTLHGTVQISGKVKSEE